MTNIIFSAVRRVADLSLSRVGDMLTVNGESFDFAVIPEGGYLPRDCQSRMVRIRYRAD